MKTISDLKSYKEERGQSTTEFALMLYLAFAVAFLVIEMGLFFSSANYTNYAAFIGARGLEGSGDYDSSISNILSGTLYRGNYGTSKISEGNGISINIDRYYYNWIGTSGISSSAFPNFDYKVNVRLGHEECRYEEGVAFEGDNDLRCD